ncbi:chromosome segregation protein SMC [Colwellia sp. 1_MG-2023]|uniref:chromosome segregation protein SMC n=1 Tax=Colwellia sp. 1_MG-2023 TaxID=3062649 RepID=UPI0026E3F4A3|nr:chromosome segregation protein SMC [Colwellia sp. 1_MG-2023]MDO6446162.1 chromosome segregation protein SMC [Colwellia sp. 1_MG-2023]
MRLKHIKLAGFKSFVDPTKVPFEQQMTAIVGPNGCGKSNIIDAVRWVLGESSAKNLRGDAMTDVIFNGASTRKPVGQASVELLFDNIAERIQGSMADRNQISIRRVVNRDSQNSYYLNGTKCRRKDITDIFLGTGLGPRSYAIIEQGTISRLIESKPQELRVFIEEAAGISKYKERRRDTENRIRHTRENLARLFDIRSELNTQIDKLHQQAEAAKRFKTLKAQERKIKAELAVLRWQKFDQQYKSNQSRIEGFQSQITQKESIQKSDEIALFTAKQNYQTANQSIQTLQQQKITLINDTARIEQQIKHQQQQQKKLLEDHHVNQQQISQAQKSLLLEQEKLNTFTDKLDELQPKYSKINLQYNEQSQQYQHCQENLLKQQKNLQAYHQQQEQQNQRLLEETTKKAQLSEIIEQKKSRLATVVEQLTHLAAEMDNKADDDETRLSIIKEQREHLYLQQQVIREKKQENQDKILQLNQQKSDIAGTCAALTREIEQLTKKLTQQHDWQKDQTVWLEKNNIASLGELQQKLSIVEGWELAIEMVLSHKLQALFIDTFPLNYTLFENSPSAFLLLNHQRSTNKNNSKANTLAEKVKGSDAINGILNQIHIAKDYQDAVALLPQLKEHESVICPEGIWLSHHFIHRGIFNVKNDHFTHAQTLAENEQNLSLLNQQFDEIVNHIAIVQDEQNTLVTQLDEIEHQLNKREQQIVDLNQLHALNKQKQESQQSQRQQLQLEQLALEQAIKASAESFSTLLTSLSGDKITNSDQTHLANHSSIQALTEKVQHLQQQVQDFQQQLSLLTTEKHQLELAIEKTKNAETQCQQHIVRFQENIKQLTAQQNHHAQLHEAGVNPLLSDEKQLQIWLSELVSLDNQLNQAQTTLSETQEIIQSSEQKQRVTVEAINELKESLNQLHVDSESYRLKAQSALEQLHELGQSVKSVQDAMPDNARESQWQAQLIKLAKDIQLLGAINLAAIEEFETQLTRKNYLDQQDQDLNLAISTLESAIEKIDKESRHKFKITFDKVNQDLQSLFPKVFGGGQAYLTLTGDDLLDTGVTIMARPPGKKNSTIHLLSGGEKALTALSLVFAIFRLNPAPFCMLDEVDAPLDDANVSRFCNLVREMSQTVQFIYISHNKIAMEMASHLTGVTMVEAGVSRMVAVDIDEAVAMAEVS